MLHQSELTKLLDVGLVLDPGLGIDGDDVATLTLLDEVEDDVIADSMNKKLKRMILKWFRIFLQFCFLSIEMLLL